MIGPLGGGPELPSPGAPGPVPALLACCLSACGAGGTECGLCCQYRGRIRTFTPALPLPIFLDEMVDPHGSIRYHVLVSPSFQC